MNNDEAKKIVDALVSRLKEIRVEKGMSHEKLANKANIHRSAISLIETRQREPKLITCIKIAGALEVDLKDLL